MKETQIENQFDDQLNLSEPYIVIIKEIGRGGQAIVGSVANRL